MFSWFSCLEIESVWKSVDVEYLSTIMHLLVLSANWLPCTLSFHLTVLLLIACVPQLGRVITNRVKEFWSVDRQYDVEKTDLVKLVKKTGYLLDDHSVNMYLNLNLFIRY